MNEGIVTNLRRAADKWEKNHPIIGVGELRVHDALRDAARCIEETSAKLDSIELAPAVDGAPVVRRKDCTWYSHGYCMSFDDDVMPNGFCNRGHTET